MTPKEEAFYALSKGLIKHLETRGMEIGRASCRERV